MDEGQNKQETRSDSVFKKLSQAKTHLRACGETAYAIQSTLFGALPTAEAKNIEDRPEDNNIFGKLNDEIGDIINMIIDLKTSLNEINKNL